MIEQRLARVREELQRQGADYLALVPGPNLAYLTGLNYMLLERPLILFLPADAAAEALLVIPELEAPPWEQRGPFPARLFPWSDADGPQTAMRAASQQIGQQCTIAAEHLRMRLLEHSLIRDHLPGAQIVAAEAVLLPARRRKDPAEVDAHRRAVRAAEAALAAVSAAVRAGMTERELCGLLTTALLTHGGETVPIEPLVQCGPNTSMPHGSTGSRSLASGDWLLFDFTTTVDGYFADITRTFVVGRPADERQQLIYNTVQAANAVGRHTARPGVPCAAVDRAVRQVIVDAGFGPYFIHRTGHGLGLEVHEEPNIVDGNPLVLAQGMVFTIEPGIYIPGWGGVRIEDNVVITQDGCESLTSFPRDLRIVGA